MNTFLSLVLICIKAFPLWGNFFALSALEHPNSFWVTVQTNCHFPFRKSEWIPDCGHTDHWKENPGWEADQIKSSEVQTENPLAGVAFDVQFWRIRQWRRLHVIFSIVFRVWVWNFLSIRCWHGWFYSYCGLEAHVMSNRWQMSFNWRIPVQALGLANIHFGSDFGWLIPSPLARTLSLLSRKRHKQNGGDRILISICDF